MKVEAYCVLLDNHRRFALRASLKDTSPLTFNKVAALQEMTDGQIVRQAVETIYLFMKDMSDTGFQVVIHIDDPPANFKSGSGVPKFDDGFDDKLRFSVEKAKSLLTTPRDFTFKRSPNGGNLV